ncbi:MAG: bifunctional diaminohydroxyphosphoribosylaminopyrimidine deaminase/5-amino-6-(5-phosphoribosylamino)uracil reductase RibD [Calditrichaeota bacterium]|nr:bifunctional diaminohydroxyphosphoribosylaminopyrimidine deaminase/5-amino-6-(5-phosphoribosylamino)uracil reductase RibD [Calditrichota bacterium]
MDKYNQYIQRCFELAKNGRSKVSPNPLVGAVIVKDGRIISEGFHAHFGGLHAEAMAIKTAKESLVGATLFCNLEPCCHTNKKTPPCLPLVINSGIKRVVLSNSDPNPNVSGKSIKQMRDAGIEVVENILKNEGQELNRFFFKHILESKPWVTLKIAQTLNGMISKNKGAQTWITGAESGKFVHKLRAEFDAVLIGAGTVRSDNPQLNVRHVDGKDPVKIVIDGKLSSDPEAKTFEAGTTWIFHNPSSEGSKSNWLQKANVRLFECEEDNHRRISIKDVLRQLGNEGINSLLVEGGQNIFSQFVSQQLFDEIIILQAPVFFKSGTSSIQLKNDFELSIYESGILGEDNYLILRKKV